MVRKETIKGKAGEYKDPENMTRGLGLKQQVNGIQDVLDRVCGRAV